MNNITTFPAHPDPAFETDAALIIAAAKISKLSLTPMTDSRLEEIARHADSLAQTARAARG